MAKEKVYTVDGILVLMGVKALVEAGTVIDNSTIGRPFVQGGHGVISQIIEASILWS